MALRIRAARKAAGMTQEELARALGINRATLSRYESGAIDPPSSQIPRIAKAVGVSTASLMGWEETGQDLAAAGLSAQDIAGALNLPPEAVQQLAACEGEEAALTLGRLTRAANQLIRQSEEQREDQELRLRLGACLDCLNAEGRQEALKRIEELAEIPRYRAGG